MESTDDQCPLWNLPSDTLALIEDQLDGGSFLAFSRTCSRVPRRRTKRSEDDEKGDTVQSPLYLLTIFLHQWH